MTNYSKLSLLKALIDAKRLEVSGPDLTKANHAKGQLIGLYRAKKYLEFQVELDTQRSNIFNKGREFVVKARAA